MILGLPRVTKSPARNMRQGRRPPGRASAAGSALSDLWTQFPEPFKSFATSVAETVNAYQYYLESLRLTLSFRTVGGVKEYTTSYEMGVAVQINQPGPGPFKDLSLKRIYLKLTG